MARFDVYQYGGKGYVLDVQSDITAGLNTRIVVPLLPLTHAPKPAKQLNPIFEIGGVEHSMVTQYLASIKLNELKGMVVNLGRHHDAIKDAMDMLFEGY